MRELMQLQQTAGSVRPIPKGTGALTWPRDPFRIALFLLTVVTISRVHQHFPVLEVVRPALLLFGFATTYAILNPRALGAGDLFSTWPPRVVVTLAVLSCFSAVFGISLGRAATFILGSYSKVIVYALLLMLAIRGTRDLVMFIRAYVISCGILIWMALFVFDLSYTAGTYAARLDNLYTYDANDLGLVLIVGLPLTLLTLETTTGWRRWLTMLVLVGIGMAIAKSGSRGAFVGLVAVGGSLLVVAKHISVRRRVGALVGVLIALAFAAPEGYWQQMGTLLQPKADYNWGTTDGRRQIAIRGVQYMARYPFFGIGIDNFPMAEGTISEKARNHVEGTGIKWTAPHNSYIQVGAEMGVPGLVGWSSLIVGGIVALRRMRRRLPAGWVSGDPDQRFLYLCTIYLPVSFIGFAVTAAFLSFAYMDHVYVLAAYTTGMYVSLRQEAKSSLMAAPRKPRVWSRSPSRTILQGAPR